MPVLLTTDILFFLLLGLAAGYAFYARKRPHILTPWYKLWKNRSAVISIVFILFYILIALLDSLHFKPRLEHSEGNKAVYANEVVSVLDIILSPLREQQERTYSEPFALYAYMKESIPGDVQKKMDYQRLKYGGSHLQSPQDKTADIAVTVAWGVTKGLGASFVVFFLFGVFNAKKYRRPVLGLMYEITFGNNRSLAQSSWRTAMITISLLLVLLFVIYHLGIKYHVLGTDKVGEDVLYQALKSIRTGVLIGTLTTFIMLPFGILFGVIAGYFLGWIDDVIQYIYTTLNSIPGVLLIAAAVLMLDLYMNQHQEAFNNLAMRSDTRLLFLCMILGVTSWTGLCRLLRAETLKVKSMDYIQAARALGISKSKIISRHVLPNIAHIIFITVALDFSGLILAEAVLSYVNIGVDPTMYSWGNMINGARLEMAREPIVWWSLVASFIFMFGLVLCANLFSDALRDAFDPRLTSDWSNND